MLQLVEGSANLSSTVESLNRKGATVHLKQMVGGAFSLYAAAAAVRAGGIHIFVAGDRDAAAYLANDFYQLLDESDVYFFPSAYKRSIAYSQQDAQGVVQRTAALTAVRGAARPYIAICTYPEALAETVADRQRLARRTLTLSVGDSMEQRQIVERLEEMSFEKVEFVYQPGQYSVRGGIVDIFSYAESKPYRIDLFGDEIDSIRRFDISSQLSSERPDTVEIIPNMDDADEERISLAAFVSEGTVWFTDADHALGKVNEIRKKLLSQLDEPSTIDRHLSSRNALLRDMERMCIVSLKDNLKERRADTTIEFRQSPQPAFNKNFEMLADDIIASSQRGYTTWILSQNKIQIERLTNIFHQIGRRNVAFRTLPAVLHEGFVDNDLKICVYTDHQIFDRYQRYRIRGEIKRDEQMTVAELNALKVGDYVVHIDHGVGRFGGLVKLNDNGRIKEAIKLIYKDNDILFVNVHALHRISRYKSGEGEPPKIYKLGGGAWQKLKTATKKAVKDISRELIDMDRLVCGDVGFGKTEVAIRAAFKAAVDGKQTAVLVPTTILALQHYRSFSERLRDLPVKVEYLTRTKSAKQTRQILEDLAAGKIDIIIGTHKILGKQVKFHDLGLLIIDEEQKFGVAAKEKLTQMSVSIDTLTLTATPIPRTLQFSLTGSRDLSIISTPPPNRQPIVTESHVFSEEVVRDAIEEELSRGGQVYFVHNRVDDLMSVEGMLQRLCPKARIGVGHGRMPAEQLERLVMDFIYGEYDVLLTTTIVENGIDVPNANTIIIDNAQNFGLSDLHQLRGRVGRSDRKAYCYLITPPNELLGGDSRRRLRAIEEFSDLGSGFNIAMQDLDIRGAGNLLGAEQSGFIADIGVETYQKIMQQAISELRSEGLDVSGLTQAENDAMQSIGFIDDATIDIDVEASLPDSYVHSQSEKLRLYRELDSLQSEEQLTSFAARLEDRFGALPEATVELMNVVRLRREAVRLGMERVKVKNGLMIVWFVGDESSPYYKSDTFMGLLRKVTADAERFVLKQHNNRLAMTVRKVRNIAQGVEVLRAL